MTNTIINHLQELEQTKNTTILMAIESGSRAWGFPSPDSDYDVRMVYLHQLPNIEVLNNYFRNLISKNS